MGFFFLGILWALQKSEVCESLCFTFESKSIMNGFVHSNPNPDKFLNPNPDWMQNKDSISNPYNFSNPNMVWIQNKYQILNPNPNTYTFFNPNSKRIQTIYQILNPNWVIEPSSKRAKPNWPSVPKFGLNDDKSTEFG